MNVEFDWTVVVCGRMVLKRCSAGLSMNTVHRCWAHTRDNISFSNTHTQVNKDENLYGKAEKNIKKTLSKLQ